MVESSFSSVTSCTATVDPRYTLTEAEREAVLVLKRACDSQGIAYNSLFELAKYVLVAHSSASDVDARAAETRLEKAVGLIKKRNEWAKKYQVASVDPQSALQELYELHPDYFVNYFAQDKEGRIVVGHHHAHSPVDYVGQSKENLAKYLAAEQYRLALGAVDMEEARRGLCLVTVSSGQVSLKRAYRYIRLAVKGQENFKSMHPHRIRKIYSEVPSIFMYLVPSVKVLLPKKIASRITIVGSMDELQQHLHTSQDPAVNVVEWAQSRHAKYSETIEKLSLDQSVPRP